MPIIYTLPMSLVMRTQECDYCNKMSERAVTTYTRLHGIKCCGEHIPLGKRDVNAYLRREGLVRQKDFLEVYPRLSDMKLNVPRTDGSITAGGNLSVEPFQMFSNEEGQWYVRVLFTDPPTGEVMGKAIKIADLDKSGISAEEIATWAKSLDEFYRADYDAHEAAAELGEKITNPDCANIKTVCVNGLEGRVFVP